jgi:hypothetical protein
MGSILGVVLGGITGGWSWLLRNPVLIAIALLCGAFVVVVISKNHEIEGLNKQLFDPKTGYAVRLNQANEGLGVERANVATLNFALKTQGDSILALKAQGDASLAKFDSIIAGQTAANASFKSRIAAIDAAKPGSDKCKAAFDLVRGSVQ